MHRSIWLYAVFRKIKLEGVIIFDHQIPLKTDDTQSQKLVVTLRQAQVNWSLAFKNASKKKYNALYTLLQQARRFANICRGRRLITSKQNTQDEGYGH